MFFLFYIFLFNSYFLSGGMFEAIQYLVSSKKLEDGFGMDNVAVVNSRGKIKLMISDCLLMF